MVLNKGLFSSLSPHWATPKALYAELDKEFHFDFDPCPLNAKFDGLDCKWGKSNYINPPYSRAITKWLEKSISERERAVFLLPARTDTRWFHELILPNAKEIRFIKGRLHFNDKGPAPFPSMIVVFEWKT